MPTEPQSLTLTRRQLRIALCTLLGIFFISLSCFGIYFQIQLDRLQSEQEKTALQTVGTADLLFTVREHDGKIGVFTPDSDTPVQILNVYVFTLPTADQRALQSGIPVYSTAELLSLIEDFTG